MLFVDGNDRFHPPVEAARLEAQTEGVVLYSAAVPCTIPVQVESVVRMVAEAPTAADQAPTAGSAQFSRAASEVAGAARSAVALDEAFGASQYGHVFAAFTSEELGGFRARLREVASAAADEELRLHEAAGAAEAREQEAVRRAEEEASAQRKRPAPMPHPVPIPDIFVRRSVRLHGAALLRARWEDVEALLMRRAGNKPGESCTATRGC